MNPNADIYVVEAKSDYMNDLSVAIGYASNTIKADVISMSWGANDVLGNRQSSYYNIFSNPSICYCAASGDSNTPSFPSSYSNVISVGGTSLLNVSPTIETTWNYGGSGYSVQVPIPSYQKNISNIKGVFRAIPDVAAIANPSYGAVIVYNNKFYVVGGTSASTPIFAAILSTSIQQRLNSNKSILLTSVENPPSTSRSLNLQTILYKSIYQNNTTNKLYLSCFNDIKTGTDGKYKASAGYDTACGLGSPNCANLCNVLASI
jgi:subtilase family serine protease